MADLVLGTRVGGYVVLTDADGRRHALRAGSILAASDVDDSQSSTCLLLHGGRVLLVLACLDDVLTWLGQA